MTYIKKVALFLAMGVIATAKESVSSTSAFRNAQTEIPQFSEAIKELNVVPLEKPAPNVIVRMIRDTGWYYYSLTVAISRSPQQANIAELKLTVFDAGAKRDLTKTMRAPLTPSESSSLRKALTSPKAFSRSEKVKYSNPPIDSGWFFIEMQTATAYKSVLRTGFVEARAGSQELATVLSHLFKRIEKEGFSEDKKSPASELTLFR